MGTKMCRTCMSGIEFGDLYRRNTMHIEGDDNCQTIPLNQPDAKTLSDDGLIEINDINEGMDTMPLPTQNPHMKRVNTIEKIDPIKSTEILEKVQLTQNEHHLERAILQRYATQKDEPIDSNASQEQKSTNVYLEETKLEWDNDQVVDLRNEQLMSDNSDMNELIETPNPSTTEILKPPKIKANNIRTSKLYRQHSPNEWKPEQVVQHENEMKEELLNLGKQITDVDRDVLASSLSTISQEILSPNT